MKKRRVASRVKLDTQSSLIAPKATDTKADLIPRLRQLLAVAKGTFKDPQSPWFSDELLEIPDIVGRLQATIGKKKAKRVPFWKCVTALDRVERPLALIRTLDELVERATKLPPSPIVRLICLQESGSVTGLEAAIIKGVCDALESGIPLSVSNLTAWPAVLEDFMSPDCAKITDKVRRDQPPTMRSPHVNRLISFAAFLDLAAQQRAWSERYMPALESFVLLLSYLENENYENKRQHILVGEVLTESDLRRNYQQFFARRRQRERRKRTAATKNSVSASTSTPNRVTKKRCTRRRIP